MAAWVHADARGKGVGDALVAEVLNWSRERGYEQVYLRVADGNQAARELFLRNGFKRAALTFNGPIYVSRDTQPVDIDHDDDHLMR